VHLARELHGVAERLQVGELLPAFGHGRADYAQ
jgi:hypothetical protein